MSIRIMLFAALLSAAAGCAKPEVRGATQVGGNDPATWVHVQTNDAKASGIFRCIEASGKVVCKRAVIEE